MSLFPLTDERIETAAREASPKLDLSWNELKKVPDAVLKLEKLEELNLHGNKLKRLPVNLARLPLLRRLDVRRNPLESLKSRPGLILDWSTYRRNRRTIRPEHVVGLRFDGSLDDAVRELYSFPNLVLLDLSQDFGAPHRSVAEVERVLARVINHVRHLEMLDLFCCGLEAWPDSISELRNLKALDLTGNGPGFLPDALAKLKNLVSLVADDTGISFIPDWLCDQVELEHLSFTNNELRELPPRISHLGRLRQLHLSNNHLITLPPAFGELSQLETLWLMNNDFSMIPEGVFELKALRSLSMHVRNDTGIVWIRGRYPVGHWKNHPGRLREIPKEILKLENLREILFNGQPIETPPLAVVNRGVDAIRDYWRQRAEAGTDYLCEAKLIIVGEPGAGKTSLANKLLDPGYPLDSAERSTEGIDVLHWSFPTILRPKQARSQRALSRDFNVNIWDFGGQEIYHATHQFFLTRRSLYVLVADSRKEDTDFHYWLNVIELLSDNSPVLIVKNEKQDRRRDIDEQGLHSRFSNLREVLATNLEGNRGLDEVVRHIRHHLEGLPHIGEALPATWKRVREVLERDTRNYISLDEYLRICEAHGFTRHGDKLLLSGYLHDLGICLHFQDDAVLKHTVILEPKWGTDAVYRVLDEPTVLGNKGRFSHKDLETIWSEPEYAPMRDELLQLMMRFRLCYPLKGTDTYIAPQLLAAAQPTYSWDARDNLVLKYRYDFMPKGIVTQLIIGLHKHISNQTLVWRSGMVLERSGARCEVIEDYPGREISVRATGAHPRELLAIVDHELDRIHGSFKQLKYETWVPCRCRECLRRAEPHFYAFEVLRRFARDGRSIQCQWSYEMVDAHQLVEDVLPKRQEQSTTVIGREAGAVAAARVTEAEAEEPVKEVLVSYAWQEDSEKVVDALEKALAERGVGLVRDKNELTYRDSIRAFMERMGRGKCVVIVLSQRYFESENCMFELTEIASHEEFRKRVFPLVLPDAGIFDVKKFIKYVKYWEVRIRELDAEMKTVELTNLEFIQDELNLYRRIRDTMNGITKVLRDMNTRTIDSHLASGFSEVVAAIEKQLGV